MKDFIDILLFASCVFILLGSLYLTFKMRFIQVRFFPELFRELAISLSGRKNKEQEHTVHPHKALFTAMSTTLGISTIVAPVIAIRLGGPGALVGFLLVAFFGSAATYMEVSLSVQHRRRLEGGGIMGGPMQYIRQIFNPKIARWYGACCLILMMAWSGAQANQLSAILDSPLLGAYRIPTVLSGLVMSVLVLFTLLGGIKRIGSFSAKLVPVMFVLYLGSCFWILLSNVDQWGRIFHDIFVSAFSPYAMANGMLVGGVVSALRWGTFKGMQTSEAGIGTQAIPHAMAETNDPSAQGKLAMFSTYTAGLVAFLSGCVALVTNTWQDPSLPIGISMVAASFKMYFSYFGIGIVAISALLFGFGTILGNSFNGSQCFNYLTENRGVRVYLFSTSAMIFFGAIADMQIFWAFSDVILAGMTVPHVAALVYYAYKSPQGALLGKQRA